MSLDLVSKLFLIGFGTTGLLGPSIGRIVDAKGRKFGTLAFAALYTLGALSVKSTALSVLMLGRLAGGIGTSLLFSAPESWLVGEHIKGGYDGKWLSQTFGWALFTPPPGNPIHSLGHPLIQSPTANSPPANPPCPRA